MSLSKLRKSWGWRHTTFAWFVGVWTCLMVAIIVIEKPSMAHAAAPVATEQVITFACESRATDGIEDCAIEVDAKAQEWLLKNSRTVEITGRQANIAAGNYIRGYAITIFYRK